jgi:YfiH family protein
MWQWQTWQDLPYLRCSLLESWRHGFFTSHFYPHSPQILTEVLAPDAVSYQLQQVHGNQVVKPSQKLTQGDGLISEQSLQAVWVASADCTPILIGDIVSRKVCAVHAGWRGTAQGIVKEAIALFLKEGCALENLRVALGPAISGTVYQVGLKVAADVCASILPATNDILSLAQTLDPSPIQADSQPDRVRLNVSLVNYMQLQQLGLKSEQMAIAPFCTYQQPEYFFSYRRTKEKKVQWSGIVQS